MKKRNLLVGLLLCFSPFAVAQLEVCNASDTTLMLSVGLETQANVVVTKGWWILYPGLCGVPEKVQAKKYYVYAQSNPVSTVKEDIFSWGEEIALCVDGTKDFIIDRQNQCGGAQTVAVKFSVVSASKQKAQLVVAHPQRKYLNLTRSKVAGLQRMMNLLGYKVGEVDGVLGKKSINAINEISKQHNLVGIDFERLFAILEEMILQKNSY